MAKNRRKYGGTKVSTASVWQDGDWRVFVGKIKRTTGHPGKVRPLFSVVAEKLPKNSLTAVAKDMREVGMPTDGVYIAHDSMGYARYVGRGNVVARLRARFVAAPHELHYFSFYMVKDKRHEKEIETLLIRAGGPHLHFNSRKRRIDIQPGDVKDF